jgi:hypothetical protein
MYKAVIKPIWTYGIELWGCASKYHTAIIQRQRVQEPRRGSSGTADKPLRESVCADTATACCLHRNEVTRHYQTL